MLRCSRRALATHHSSAALSTFETLSLQSRPTAHIARSRPWVCARRDARGRQWLPGCLHVASTTLTRPCNSNRRRFALLLRRHSEASRTTQEPVSSAAASRLTPLCSHPAIRPPPPARTFPPRRKIQRPLQPLPSQLLREQLIWKSGRSSTHDCNSRSRGLAMRVLRSSCKRAAKPQSPRQAASTRSITEKEEPVAASTFSAQPGDKHSKIKCNKETVGDNDRTRASDPSAG